MKTLAPTRLAALAAGGLLCTPATYAADKADPRQLERAVNEAIAPMMKAHNVPGMAIAVTAGGKQYFFNYGVTAKRSGKPVTESTLFEIGSVSKTFTATLAGYAQARGLMSLSDPAGKYLPALAGSALGTTSLLDLGTYAAGGLPLQFPETVNSPQAMTDYFKAWRPAYAAGTHRRYSNPSIGLFGYLAARSLGEPFDDLMEKTLFPAFGLKRTYIRVPKPLMADYAWGYTKDDKPMRVTPGVLDSEAYGVKTTSADMIRFVEANMAPAGLDGSMQRAIATTRTGYFKVGGMVQGLGLGDVCLSDAGQRHPGGQLAADGVRGQQGRQAGAAAGAGRRCARQQDRVDQRVWRIRRVRAGKAHRTGHARQQEHAGAGAGGGRVPHPDSAGRRAGSKALGERPPVAQ